MDKLIDAIMNARHVAALTGAGVSTLCGIPDFRGPQGLYGKPDAQKMFDVDFFDRDPSLYYRGCRELVYGLEDFKPGPVHFALKHLEDIGRLDGISTQNIDMLHQKAGSSRVHEIHGSPRLHHCRFCGAEKTFEEICDAIRSAGDDPAFVPRCRCGGPFKPDITFFGESLPEGAYMKSVELMAGADVLLVLGTSLTVSPANLLPRHTLQAGGKVFIVNAQPTGLDPYAAGRWPDLAEFAERALAL